MSEHTTESSKRAPRVRLLSREEAPEQTRRAFDADETREGRVRYLTQAVAASPATWQTTARATHMYVTLRRVDAVTRSLLCLYTSFFGGCRYCIDDAAGAALEDGVTPSQLLALRDVPSAGFDTRTTAALRYAEHVTLTPTAIPDEVVDALTAQVDEEELLEITSVVAMKCFWNRLLSSLRIPPEGYVADAGTARALYAVSDELRRSRGLA